MAATFNYIIEANLGLTLVLGFYLLFLRKETNFSLLRFFLLAGIMSSLIFPMIHLQDVQNSSALSIGQMIPSYWLPEVTIGAEQGSAAPEASGSVWQYTTLIYQAGSILFALLIVFQLGQLMSIIRKSRTYRFHKLRVAESEEDRPTFSFFNFIFIGKANTLSAEEKKQIIQHESVHAAQWHSFDILLINAVQIFFWFNPFLHLYKKTFIQLHEFEADARAVENSDVNKYCSLLAKVALQATGFKLVNHFNNSLTVKRIEMMRAIKTNIQRWRLAALTLVFPAMFFFVACNDQVEQDLMTITKNSTHALVIPEQVQKAFEGVQATYPERKYVLLELNEAASKKIDDMKGQYGLPSSITVLKTSNGKIVEASQNRTSDASILSAQPAPVKDGDVQTFAIVEFTDEASRITEAAQEDKIYTVVEKQPEYPGGYNAMVEFIKQNLQYPADARLQGKEGTTYVSFIVQPDGAITDTKVVRGLSASIDQEAMRVVNAFPNWIPGKQSGVNVAVRFVLPVKFSLGREETKK